MVVRWPLRERDSVLDTDMHRLILAVGEWPWWAYSPDDFPGRTRAEIEAGLTVPACEEAQQ